MALARFLADRATVGTGFKFLTTPSTTPLDDCLFGAQHILVKPWQAGNFHASDVAETDTARLTIPVCCGVNEMPQVWRLHHLQTEIVGFHCHKPSLLVD
jgi:hypothetical protein